MSEPILKPELLERIYRAFFTPGRPAGAPEALQAIAAGHTRTVATAAGALPVTRWGDGARRALLVHGWGGSRAQVSALAAPLNALGFAVDACDLPAHGEAPGEQTNVFVAAPALKRVIDDGPPPELVITHSFGSVFFAVAIARLGAVAPPRLVLLAPFNRMMDAVPRFVAQARLDASIGPALHALIRARLGTDVEAIVTADLLSRAAPRTLVVHAPDDPVTPFSDAQAIADALPHARLLPTPGLGHRGPIGDGTVHREIAGFVAAG